MTVRDRGFTLLETLVALALLAIVLSATFRALGMATQTAGDLRQRLLADWVAENRLSELRASRLFPDPGSFSGMVEQAGQQFHWRQEVAATSSPRLRRVDILVFTEPGDSRVISRLSAHLAKAQP